MHFDDDLSLRLDGDAGAVDYAGALLRACAMAEYDAAVFAQLKTIGNDPEMAAGALVYLRESRGEPTVTRGPVTVAPGVSVFTGAPFLLCTTANRSWQWTPAILKEHVGFVIEIGTAAANDTLYLRWLVDECGVDPTTARATVARLAKYRPA